MNAFSIDALHKEFTSLVSRRRFCTPARQNRIDQFHNNQERNVRLLYDVIQDRKYYPKYQGVLITQKKPDGSSKIRGITPLSVQDWLVQRILLREMNLVIGDSIQTAVSYGRISANGESARSPINCCKEIAKARADFPFAFRADLIDFFPSVDRAFLKEALDDILPDDWAYRWILDRSIDSDVRPPADSDERQREKFWPVGRGVHQGIILAPSLCNIVMRTWDEKWASEKLYRYVDDWLVLAASERELREKVRLMVDSLPDGVSCHTENSEKCDYVLEGHDINFLGLSITSLNKVKPSDQAIAGHERRLQAISDDSGDIVTLTMKLSRFNEAWKKYYHDAGLTQDGKKLADNRLTNQINKWFNGKNIGGKSQQGRFIKLLLDYRASIDRNMIKHLEEELVTGELLPDSISDVLN